MIQYLQQTGQRLCKLITYVEIYDRVRIWHYYLIILYEKLILPSQTHVFTAYHIETPILVGSSAL